MKRSIKRIKFDIDQINDKERLSDQEVAELDQELQNTKKSTTDILENSLGLSKKPAMLSTNRRKEASLVARKAELQEVQERLKAKRKALQTELQEAEADNEATQRTADFMAYIKRTQDLNEFLAKGDSEISLLERMGGTVIALADMMLDLNSQGKNLSDYFDLIKIIEDASKLFLHGPDGSRIQKYNLLIQNLLARLNSAIEGKRGYSKVSVPIVFTPTEQQNTEAQDLRQEMERDRFRHGSALD